MTSRSEEIDEQYAAAYAKHPLDEPDEWGDLESFLNALARIRSRQASGVGVRSARRADRGPDHEPRPADGRRHPGAPAHG